MTDKNTEETLQWMYSMVQETTKLLGQMEKNLSQNKPLPIYENIQDCKLLSDTLLKRVLYLAEDVHEIKITEQIK